MKFISLSSFLSRILSLFLSLSVILIFISACAQDGTEAVAGPQELETPNQVYASPPAEINLLSSEYSDWRISVIGPSDGFSDVFSGDLSDALSNGISGDLSDDLSNGFSNKKVWSFNERELAEALHNLYLQNNSDPPYPAGSFVHIFSTINNWPTERFYVAEGYSVAAVLMAAGLYEIAQRITFRGLDGYEITLTREQLLSPQYFFPYVGEGVYGAQRVYPIIAYLWRDGTDNMDNIREDKPRLIIGQQNPFEHTNPTFVGQLAEIIVCDKPVERWPIASTFPMPGPVHSGDTINLQHPNFGLVKLHYTIDGTEPTVLSPMFNPSTFQPELNVPISIYQNTTIKVLVHGYGRANSEIAVFEFLIADGDLS